MSIYFLIRSSVWVLLVHAGSVLKDMCFSESYVASAVLTWTSRSSSSIFFFLSSVLETSCAILSLIFSISVFWSLAFWTFPKQSSFYFHIQVPSTWNMTCWNLEMTELYICSWHCPLSGPDLIYISLLIIPCIIYYVTNKETLNLELQPFEGELISRKDFWRLPVN